MWQVLSRDPTISSAAVPIALQPAKARRLVSSPPVIALCAAAIAALVVVAFRHVGPRIAKPLRGVLAASRDGSVPEHEYLAYTPQ